MEHTLATCVKHILHPNKKTLANIRLKTDEIFSTNLKHAFETLATYAASKYAFATST
jgi:hypothetical protein